jgi:hypothetical protein
LTSSPVIVIYQLPLRVAVVSQIGISSLTDLTTSVPAVLFIPTALFYFILFCPVLAEYDWSYCHIF